MFIQVLRRYTLGAARQALPAVAAVPRTYLFTSTVNADLVNGMTVHVDETDAPHFSSRSHLGCDVVPTAMAMAEK